MAFLSSGLRRMSTIFKKSNRNLIRPFSTSYDADGETNVVILNQEVDSPLMIDEYNQFGFRLNNGMYAVGPIAIFPKTIVGWKINSPEDITPETLTLFLNLEPKLDILVIGLGDRGKTLNPEAIKALRKARISFEVLSSDNACSTFNFLNAERRAVAGAIIPPRNVKPLNQELFSELKEKDYRDSLSKNSDN